MVWPNYEVLHRNLQIPDCRFQNKHTPGHTTSADKFENRISARTLADSRFGWVNRDILAARRHPD
jgi:hypothetical protein